MSRMRNYLKASETAILPMPLQSFNHLIEDIIEHIIGREVKEGVDFKLIYDSKNMVGIDPCKLNEQDLTEEEYAEWEDVTCGYSTDSPTALLQLLLDYDTEVNTSIKGVAENGDVLIELPLHLIAYLYNESMGM